MITVVLFVDFGPSYSCSKRKKSWWKCYVSE